MNEIPQGIKTIAEISGESADDIWQALQVQLNNDEVIALFNETVESSLKTGKEKGLNGLALGAHILNEAGEAILGPNRPSSDPLQRVIEAASPLLKKLPPKKKRQQRRRHIAPGILC